jgi:hypothetical protein
VPRPQRGDGAQSFFSPPSFALPKHKY